MQFFDLGFFGVLDKHKEYLRSKLGQINDEIDEEINDNLS